MNYQTELMRSILTSERAQKIIDYVSPIYGNSYVGLWLYQIMGVALDEVYNLAVDLRHETTPSTTERLIDYWEDSLGIPRNYSLTLEQRRARLISWRDRGPCNPHRLAAAVSAALNGVEVDIQENIAKNTFLVNVREVVYDWSPIEETLKRKKPAHLIYIIRVATQVKAETSTYVAVGATHCEKFSIEIATPAAELTPSDIDAIWNDVFVSGNVRDGEIPLVAIELNYYFSLQDLDNIWDGVFEEGV